MKEKTDIVFVILVYSNYFDLYDFIKSLKNVKCKYRIIVIDSFYSDEVSGILVKYCESNFIEYKCVENKGYGFGNNIGFDLAINKFDFRWIVLCNPDIEILKFDINILVQYDDSVIGPKIIRNDLRNQNPFYFKKSKLVNTLKRKSAIKKSNLYLFFAILINKLNNLFHHIYSFGKDVIKVEALHGSFIILPKKIFDKGTKIFDEKIFLFTEEEQLADYATMLSMQLLYSKKLLVKHKEDGSFKSTSYNQRQLLFESYQKYYHMKDISKKNL